MFFNITTPKFAAQAIKKMPRSAGSRCTSSTTSRASIGSVMKPAGFENAQGIISSNYLKDPTDPQWKNDAGMKAFDAFLDKYYPGRQPGRWLGDVRLHRRAGPRAGAEGSAATI